MAIIKTGKQLIKESASRWKDFVQNMSKANRKRLITEGIAKSEDAYIYGINRGTANILKRYGYTRGNIDAITPAQASKAQASVQRQYVQAQAQNDPATMRRNLSALSNQIAGIHFGSNPSVNPKNSLIWTGAATLPLSKIIHTKNMVAPNSIVTDKGKRFFDAIINRHEAYEATSGEKVMSNYFKNTQKGDTAFVTKVRRNNPGLPLTDQQIIARAPYPEQRALYLVKTPGRFVSSSNSPAGSHISMDVLGKERKLLDTFPYKENDGYHHLRHSVRKREYTFMDRTGEYKPGTPERYSGRNFRKMTKKIKPGVPLRLRRNETWTPLY